VSGLPRVTTTVDGKYLPSPPPTFGGEVALDAAQSKPYWPPAVVPPKGSPNVLLIMTDDAGYGGRQLRRRHSDASAGPERAGATGWRTFARLATKADLAKVNRELGLIINRGRRNRPRQGCTMPR
jgi:hypothetical protein